MPGKRLHMRKTHEVLRLKSLGLSNRKIAECCQIGRTTVSDYLRRSSEAGLSWDKAKDMPFDELECLIFTVPEKLEAPNVAPDWSVIRNELSKKGVTLYLLWEEYKAQNPDGYHYSWFCKLYRAWAKKVDVTMRMHHKAGEKLFIDYAGQTVKITDPASGDIKEAQIFVSVLGASNYTYAEATWTQNLQDWIGSNTRALEFYGGVPMMIVPDNLKSGVTKPCYYEPSINMTYEEWAKHYDVAILPARVRRPKDKAKVESGVLLVERWILARLRNQDFFSLTELNMEVKKLVELLNNKRFQKMDGSRLSVFESTEKPALAPLPSERFEFAHWLKYTVNNQYHVEVDGHVYSVPYDLAGKRMDIRVTETMVEVFCLNKRVASHIRNYDGKPSTLIEHMPANHRFMAGLSQDSIMESAQEIGPYTAMFAALLYEAKKVPQQADRSMMGVIRLARSYSRSRVDAACQRAIRINTLSLKSVESILKRGLDTRPIPEEISERKEELSHINIRGPEYFAIPGKMAAILHDSEEWK